MGLTQKHGYYKRKHLEGQLGGILQGGTEQITTRAYIVHFYNTTILVPCKVHKELAV